MFFEPKESLHWTIADDDDGRRLDGLPNPRMAEPRSGDFRRDLTHEFGHWLAAQQQGLTVEFLGLYGLEYDQSRIRVTRGGLVVFNSRIADHFARAVVAVAGVVAERLDVGTYSDLEDPAAMFRDDPAVQSDWTEARQHLRADADATGRPTPIERATRKAAELLGKHVGRIRTSVLHLESVMARRRADAIEIVWSGDHAALLTGQRRDDFEVRYDDLP